MGEVSIGIGKNKVTHIALYRIEEDAEHRLVLRGKVFHMYLGGAFLIGVALIFGWAATTVKMGGAIAFGLAAALVLLGGAALIRKAARSQDRIVFDRATEVVSFDMTRAQDRFSVPFHDIDRIELRRDDRSTSTETRIIFPLYIVKKNGDEFKVDEATNKKQMTQLATKAAAVCRARFQDVADR